jgi:flagellar basal-body rod protein FlgF
VSIDADGSIRVVQPGGDPNIPELVDRIKLVSTEGTRIQKATDGLFRAAEGGVLPPDLDARATTGALEQSNVNATMMMVEMIENQRSFDSRSKLLTTARDLDQAGASLMRIS